MGLEPEPNLGRLGGNLYILKHQFTTTHVRTNSFSGRTLKSEMSIDVILDSLVVIIRYLVFVPPFSGFFYFAAYIFISRGLPSPASFRFRAVQSKLLRHAISADGCRQYGTALLAKSPQV